MTRISASSLAFVLGFAATAALILSDPVAPGAPTSIAEPPPWTQHRAGALLAQESLEMRDLRAAGRLALGGSAAPMQP